MQAPKEPVGTNSFASWCKRMVQYVLSLELKNGRGYKVRRTPSGTYLDIDPSSPYVSRLAVVLHQGDHLVCVAYDGTNYGTDLVYVAKPPELRFSLLTETIDATEITYSDHDTDAQTRTADDGSTTEDQIIVPRYIEKDTDIVPTELFAIRANTGLTVEVDASGADVSAGQGRKQAVSYIDLNVAGRAWAESSV